MDQWSASCPKGYVVRQLGDRAQAGSFGPGSTSDQAVVRGVRLAVMLSITPQRNQEPSSLDEEAFRANDSAGGVPGPGQIRVDQSAKKTRRPGRVGTGVGGVELFDVLPHADAAFIRALLNRGDLLPGKVDDMLDVVQEVTGIVIAAEQDRVPAIELHAPVERAPMAEWVVPRRRKSGGRCLPQTHEAGHTTSLTAEPG